MVDRLVQPQSIVSDREKVFTSTFFLEGIVQATLPVSAIPNYYLTPRSTTKKKKTKIKSLRL